MGKIAIENIKIYAFHGYYEEEQKIGAEYSVDVYLETNFTKAASSDDLEGTINYETIARIIKTEMAKKSKLIEHVMQRIINRIKTIFDSIETLTVRISKLNPPLGVDTARVYVEHTESYVQKCAKCGKNFLSQIPGDNWTKYGLIYPETRATLTRTFGAAMCKACLEPHFIKAQPEE